MKIIILLFVSTFRCQTNLQDAKQVASIARKLADVSLAFYIGSPGGDGLGAVQPNSAKDSSGVQWYESGIFWGGALEYQRSFGDSFMASQAATALGLATGEGGSLLGDDAWLSEQILGKWNDDIMWWGLAVLTGAELYGLDAHMPNKITYLKSAQITYDQVWQQWDTKCGGGIYWVRDRKRDSKKGYKSSITNGFLKASLVYEWMKSSGLITPSWQVLDGMDAENNCKLASLSGQTSYISGMLIGALGWYFKATGRSEFLQDGSKLLQQFNTLNLRNGTVTDRCEPKCAPNAVPPKGTAIRGLGYYAAFTKDVKDKQILQTILKSSVEKMLATCDTAMNCGTHWNLGTKSLGSDFHASETALELMSAYNLAMTGFKNDGFETPAGVDDYGPGENHGVALNFEFMGVCILLTAFWLV